MPNHEDSLGGETFSGEEQQDSAEQSLGDGATMGGDTAAHSLGDQSTFGDANMDDELFDDGMELVDLSTRYTEEGVLGKGGMGEVIRATDTRLNRKVAIKRIIGKAARSKTAVQRFLTEAQSMAELSHPNIVQIHDYGRSTDGPFLIMECVQGGSLLEKCKAGPIELDEAVNIFGQLCDGLAKAHAANIIHRDIKPANVLMTEDGIPKLTDFGLAKDDTADTGMTMEGAVIGTLDFMPPEQRRDSSSVDERSDLWSLAATFYQMLTGKSPKVIRERDIPVNMRDLLMQGLEEDPADRFSSAIDFKRALLSAASSVVVAPVKELTSGVCPACNAVNADNRKFCGECAESLRTVCLGCNIEMAVWDKICGECGGRQTELKHQATEKAAIAEIHTRETLTNTLGMTFNNIPAGTFLMGSQESELGRGRDEHQHRVTISKSFYMQITEVTQRQWQAVMGSEPWKGKEYVHQLPNYAATFVNWDDAIAYCKILSAKEGKTYRLPTEAEWEYACRAGTETQWSFGNDENVLSDYARHKENALDIDEQYAHQVGLKNPNAFGLYDMHGNVCEWCHDYYGGDYYKQSPAQDPTGPAFGFSRVLRGGSWNNSSRFTRSAVRLRYGADNRYSNVGFRLVRELD